MRRLLVLASLAWAAFAGGTYADALATSVCVIEKAKFEELAKEAGTVEKISTEKLWAAGFCGYLGENLCVRIEREGRAFELLASRGKTGTIYSLSARPAEKAVEGKAPAAQLVSVGVIAQNEEVKKDWKADAFVVVLRSGNFALQ